MGRINPDPPMINLLNQVQSKNFYKDPQPTQAHYFFPSVVAALGCWVHLIVLGPASNNTKLQNIYGKISENWFDIDGYMQS